MRAVSKRILFATDGSEKAELATRTAVELANSTDSELHMLHVGLLLIDPPYPDVLDWGWGEDLGRAEREARQVLDEQVRKVEDAGGTVAAALLRRGRTGRGDRRARRGAGGMPDRRGEVKPRTYSEGAGRGRLRSGRPSRALSGPGGSLAHGRRQPCTFIAKNVDRSF